MNAWRHGSSALVPGVVLLGIVLGCQAAAPKVLPSRPDFPGLLTLAGSENNSLVRGQKGDQPAKSLLEGGPQVIDPREQRSARVRALVNGDPILDEEVIASAYSSLVGSKTEAEKAEILNRTLTEIIDREVVIQDAVARLSKGGGARFLKELYNVASKEFERQWLHRLMQANGQTDEEVFKRFLRDSGMPFDLVRRSWERNFVAMEWMRTKIEPQLNKIGHLELVQYYAGHPEEFRIEDAAVWQDIFIAQAKHPTPEDAKKLADAIAIRSKRGEDFVKLAKQYDNGDSSLRPDATGIGTKRGEIKPAEVEEVVLRLHDKETGPVIEVPGRGYHVVRMLNRTKAGKKPFNEEVQKEIREKLKGKVFSQEMKRITADLKRRAVIEIANEIK